MKQCGQLMSSSHQSCSQLYQCSSPGLDTLTGLATSLAGCLGARLTGAGWGGCMVAMVREDSVDTFLQHLKETYYRPRNIPEDIIKTALFVTKPGSGASITNIL